MNMDLKAYILKESLERASLLFFLVLCLCACKSDSLETPEEGIITPKADSMHIFSEGFVNITSSANEMTISFYANTNWYVDVGRTSWIEVSPKVGSAGDASISIRVNANMTHDKREGIVVIAPSEMGNAKGFKIIQNAARYFDLSTNAIDAISWGQRVGVGIETNVDYQIEIEEDVKEWIKYTGSRTSESPNMQSFIVEENTGINNREGKIYFKNALNTDVLTITQDAAHNEDEPIIFEDDYVKSLCIELWDTNGDRELSHREAAKAKNLGTEWQYDGVNYFDEFRFFKQINIVPPYFFAYSSLKYITLPHSVTTIEDGAFANCDGLMDIILSHNLTTIKSNAFYGCGNLKTITIYAETPPIIENGYLEGLNPEAIYVPHDSINAYKNASGWDKFASVICSMY